MNLMIPGPDGFIMKSLISQSLLSGWNIDFENSFGADRFVSNDNDNIYVYFGEECAQNNADGLFRFREERPDKSLTYISGKTIEELAGYERQELFLMSTEYCLFCFLDDIEEPNQRSIEIRLVLGDTVEMVLKRLMPEIKLREEAKSKVQEKIGEEFELRCYLAISENKIAGFALLTYWGSMVFVDRLFVSPKYRGHGIAGELIRHTLYAAKIKRKKMAFVRTQRELCPFFNRVGFIEGDTLRWYQFKGWKIDASTQFADPVMYNATLRTPGEYENIVDLLDLNNLPKHPDISKNWDSFAALKIVLRHFGSDRKSVKILDTGGEFYSAILPQLAACGYTNLTCINVSIKSEIKVGDIIYKHGDITDTEFTSSKFDVILCLSVIEHGVEFRKFFSEMYRILKRDGILIISTDYWSDGIDTAGAFMYGYPVKIFNSREIYAMVDDAEEEGFHLIGELDLICNERVVHCIGLEYTFVYFSLKKGLRVKKSRF